MKQYEIPDYLFNSIDTISLINNSLQSKQLNRLKPTSLIENESNPNIVYQKTKKNIKIAPELKGAVEALKIRLKNNKEIIKVPYPSSRFKILPNSQVSPDKYHKKSESTGGFEFTKSARMNNTLDHRLEIITTLSSSPKKKSTMKDYELKNIETVREISDYFSSVRVKIKDHNQKVAKIAIDNKRLKHEQSEKKKSIFLTNRENMKWKENCRVEIKKGNRFWSFLLVFCSVPCYMKSKLIKKIRYKKKIFRLINQFRIISKYLGKLLILIKKKRIYLFHRNVKVFATPATQFIIKQRKFFSKELNKFLFKISNTSHFIRLMISWKRQVMVIQQAIKNFLAIRDSRVLAISCRSNKAFTRPSRRSTLVPKAFEDAQIVLPSRKKKILEYIRLYIKKQIALKKPIFLFSDLKALQESSHRALF